MRVLENHRVAAVGIGHAGMEVLNGVFDYAFYPTLILWLGVTTGGAIFFVSALLLNYLVIVWYRWTETDWFGLHWLRLQEKAKSERLLGRLLSSAEPIVYVGLCFYDPIYGFIYMRGRGRGSPRFSSRDWKWFLLSNLIGIMFWIIIVSGVIESIKIMIR